TEQIAEKAKAQVIRTKVGSVEVSRRMVPEKALIGFEENGGFMYGKHNAVRDGCMTLGLLLDLLSETNNTLSAALDSLPTSYTTKDKIKCTRQQAKKLINSLKKQHRNYDDSDGIKITLGEKTWVMVRPSGTEPIARIYAEADSQEKLDYLIREYLAKARTILR
ncbi:MAG: phosphoglucosamine mutase, partial [Candidatus Nitrosotenuis sp.]